MTVYTFQKNKSKVRYVKHSTEKNIKYISIKSTKRLIGYSMFVQQIRDTLHKDGFKPRKSKFRFEISDKAADFNSKILRRKKFYTWVFREKDTVKSPGY